MNYQADVLERPEIKLVGFSILESLNKVIETKIGGILRKELETRMSEIDNRVGRPGMYLIQIYPLATYDFINLTYGGRPIDIEFWNDIHTLENEDSHIDIYIPSK